MCLPCVLFFHELNWVFDPHNPNLAAQGLQKKLKDYGLKDKRGEYVQIQIEYFSGVSGSFPIYSLENFWWWAAQFQGKIEKVLFENYFKNIPWDKTTLSLLRFFSVNFQTKPGGN